ncbi:MAG: flagellar hook-basal body complex protein [Clostridia bacterium]
MSSPLLHVPASGLTTAQAYLAALANIAANADTTGFGASLPVIDAANPYAGRSPQATVQHTPAPGLLGLDAGSVIAATPTSWTGSPSPSSTSTNIGIEGAGFFAVSTPSGSLAYTRNGAFTPDATGQLVLADGSHLIPPTTIFADASWSLGADGGLIINHVAHPPIQLAMFANAGALINLGDGLWAPSADSGPAQLVTPGTKGAGTLVPGALNSSGVSLAQTFSSLIAAQAAYEANATALKVGQQSLQALTSQPL